MRVQDCLCVLSLRAGTLAVGICHLILGVIAVAVYITSQSALDIFTTDEAARKTSFAVALCLVIKMLLSIFLVYGVCKGKTGVLLTWIAVSAVCVVLTLAGSIVLLVGTVSVNGLSVGSVLGVLLDTAMMIYFLIVVHSYRKFLLERRAGQGKA